MKIKLSDLYLICIDMWDDTKLNFLGLITPATKKYKELTPEEKDQYIAWFHVKPDGSINLDVMK